MEDKARFRKALTRRLAQISILVLLQALALFLPAGRWDWGSGWIYLAVYLLFILGNALVLLRRSGAADLMEERGELHADIKGWDRLLAPLTGFGGLLILVVCGLDQRFGWSAIHTALRILGLAGMIFGDFLFGWAMTTNRYFSVVVRIQNERGHTVCDQGPYRYLRHPGYLGLALNCAGIPLWLGSWWGFIPFALLAAAVVARTYFEDRTLRTELPGYAAYAARVRSRLIPGVW